MATGDILSVTARADGWSADVKIEGFTTGATYNFGTPGATGTSKFYINVTSEGYDATGSLGTIARVVYGTKAVRKPYPDHATIDETVDGSDIIVRVALSESIYNDDTISGVVVAAAWATNTGGGAQTSNAYSGSGTSSSTLDYPVAFGQWDIVAGVCTKERVKADFIVAVNAFHGHGIACVKITATGGTSSHSETATVTTQTATQRSATGLYMSAYQTTIPISGFTQGETITLRHQIYPLVGDADSIQDTTGRTTAANECLGWNAATLICDKNNALDSIKYVNSSTGNDSTGDGSSGNPWATIAKAYLTSGVNIVKLMGTGLTYTMGTSGTRRTTSEWVIIEPDTGATPTIQLTTTKTYRLERLCFRNLPITLASTGSWLDGETLNFVWFDLCTFNNTVGTATTGPVYRSLCSYITNCDGDGNEWQLSASFSTSHVAVQMDGVAFDAIDASTANAKFRCVCSTNQRFAQNSTSNPSGAQNGAIFCNNTTLDFSSTSNKILELGTLANITNLAICGNVFEKTGTTSPSVHIFGDNCAFTGTHVIFSHNTVVGVASGCRVNQFYNDIGTTSYDHKHVFETANHLQEANVKTDTFGTPNTNRVGNWDQLYGVNFADNNFDDASSSGFLQEFPGVRATTGSPTFTDSASDDWSPDVTDTVLKGGATALAYLLHDLLGTQRGATYDRGAINTTSAEILGDLSVTLDAITPSATGAVDVVGASTPTLDTIGISAAGAVDVAGAVDAILESISISGAGVVDVNGSATLTLETIAASINGVVDIYGTLIAALDDLTVDAETESDTPEHSVAVTVYGPRRSVSVCGVLKDVTVYGPVKNLTT